MNVDDSSTQDDRTFYGLTDRSQYILVEPDGTIWRKWFGPLNEADMMIAMTEFLSELR